MTKLICLLLGHNYTIDKGSGITKQGVMYDGFKIKSNVCLRCGKELE